MKALTIGKVARLAGVGVETVRFYERKGLIPKPPRSKSGYRQYPVETIHRLRFIRRAKELGFTLREIKELLDLRVDGASAATCDTVCNLAEEKIADVCDRIKTLQRMESVLSRLVCNCRNRAITSGCPILKALEQEESE